LQAALKTALTGRTVAWSSRTGCPRSGKRTRFLVIDDGQGPGARQPRGPLLAAGRPVRGALPHPVRRAGARGHGRSADPALHAQLPDSAWKPSESRARGGWRRSDDPERARRRPGASPRSGSWRRGTATRLRPARPNSAGPADAPVAGCCPPSSSRGSPSSRHPVGRDPPGQQPVHPDPPRAQLLRERLGETRPGRAAAHWRWPAPGIGTRTDEDSTNAIAPPLGELGGQAPGSAAPPPGRRCRTRSSQASSGGRSVADPGGGPPHADQRAVQDGRNSSRAAAISPARGSRGRRLSAAQPDRPDRTRAACAAPRRGPGHRGLLTTTRGAPRRPAPSAAA